MDWTSTHKRRIELHRQLEAERRLREKQKRLAVRKGIKKQPIARLRYLIIPVPTVLDFEQNYEQTARFLDQIRRTSAVGGHTMFIGMRRCGALSPEVALVLAAEIERCRHHRPHSVNGNNPRDSSLSLMLRDIGFHKLLGFKEPTLNNESGARTFLQMKSGVQGAGQHADDLRALVLGNASTSDDFRDDLVRGLNEAVLNVHQHAYEEGIENPYIPMPNRRWWIAGYRDADAKEIGFIAFDQGVGIPATLPRKHAEFVSDMITSAAKLLTGMETTSDHLLIKRAFELGRSRTGRESQGKGLQDFKKFLDVAGGSGSLRVLSGRGSYIYHRDGTELVEPLLLPFHGTLIVWRLTDSPAVCWENVL